MRDPKAYENRIRECVRLHASDPVHLDGTPVVPAPAPATATATATATAVATPTNANVSAGSGSGSGSGSGNAAVASASSNANSSSSSSISTAVAGASSSASSSVDVSDMSSANDKPPAAATTNPDNANGEGGDAAGGKNEGADEDAEMRDAPAGAGAAAPGTGKAGDDKRRDSTAGSDDSGDGGESSRRSSSGSDFMMEVCMNPNDAEDRPHHEIPNGSRLKSVWSHQRCEPRDFEEVVLFCGRLIGFSYIGCMYSIRKASFVFYGREAVREQCFWDAKTHGCRAVTTLLNKCHARQTCPLYVPLCHPERSDGKGIQPSPTQGKDIQSPSQGLHWAMVVSLVCRLFLG